MLDLIKSPGPAELIQKCRTPAHCPLIATAAMKNPLPVHLLLNAVLPAGLDITAPENASGTTGHVTRQNALFSRVESKLILFNEGLKPI